MKKSYKQILDEIEVLRGQAEEIRQQEVGAVIARIREAIDFYGLTPADLGFVAGKASAAPRQRAGNGGSERPPKYRDAQGNVWSGRGPRPKWLRDAIAAGKSKEDFLVRY